MAYRLRPITADDRDGLQAIFASTRTDELALTGWPEAQCQAFVAMQFEAQWQHYTRHYPDALCQLILQDGGAGNTRVAGRLWVDRRADTVHVLDIALLPEARGQGLGGACLRDLIDEARRRQVSLTISVEIHNPARRLYERLGFEAQGEAQGLYQRMAWQPATPRQLEHQE